MPSSHPSQCTLTFLLLFLMGAQSFNTSPSLSRLSSQNALSDQSKFIHRPNKTRTFFGASNGSVDDGENSCQSLSSSLACVNRRDILHLATKAAVASSALLGLPDLSLAASSIPSPAELKKLQLGHARVQYLLKNWDELTQTCNNKAMSSTEQKQVVRTEGGGGGFCDKTPLIVQEYLGYKSTNDPLFRADKLMLRAVPLVDDSVLDAEDYVDLVERYREKADQTSLMAYTSSWGEANPNGGKEVVDEYLERTKEEVLETEQLLRKVLGCLKLDILPPSEQKA